MDGLKQHVFATSIVRQQTCLKIHFNEKEIQ